MGILTELFTLKGTRKSRDKPSNALSGNSHTFFVGQSTSGKRVNEKTAMTMSAVYSCVRILSETLASLPLHIYEVSETGTSKALNHPLYKVLHDEPNAEMTSFIFRETLMTHLLLWGNAYAQIIRNGKGEVLALYPLMPDKMKVDRDEMKNIIYTYQGADGTKVTLSSQDVLHIPGLGFDGLVGYSPIAMAKNAIGMAIATEEYGAKFFANGATPSGILEHPGTVKNPQAVRESWSRGFSRHTHEKFLLSFWTGMLSFETEFLLLHYLIICVFQIIVANNP
ncbi:phage portal protein, partial [Streptococcus suis]